MPRHKFRRDMRQNPCVFDDFIKPRPVGVVVGLDYRNSRLSTVSINFALFAGQCSTKAVAVAR